MSSLTIAQLYRDRLCPRLPVLVHWSAKIIRQLGSVQILELPAKITGPTGSLQRARTLPDVLLLTVNVRRKRHRRAVTDVPRAGSRPYFEWESELRWRMGRTTVAFAMALSAVLLLSSSIDCEGRHRFCRCSADDRCTLRKQYCPHCTALRLHRTACIIRPFTV